MVREASRKHLAQCVSTVTTLSVTTLSRRGQSFLNHSMYFEGYFEISGESSSTLPL